MPTDIPNIRHMRVFLETVKTGSVSLAAERCSLSQPAATQAVSRLEAEVETSLLIRNTRRFTPTPCGALFAGRIEAALGQLNKGARASLRGAKEGGDKRKPYDRRVTSAQLRALIAVANAGSFTVAANALGRSQPTVHRAARSLEEVAGVPFFKTTASGVELTAAAQAFAMGAKLAQAEIRQGFEEISKELAMIAAPLP